MKRLFLTLAIVLSCSLARADSLWFVDNTGNSIITQTYGGQTIGYSNTGYNFVLFSTAPSYQAPYRPIQTFPVYRTPPMYQPFGTYTRFGYRVR